MNDKKRQNGKLGSDSGSDSLSSRSRKYSYKSSGVDLDRASTTMELIRESVISTFNDKVINDLSSFAGLLEIDLKGYKKPVLTSSTDGVGTKILVAKKMECYKYIGQDLVAMCVNDILCTGAKPLFFLDYIACGKIEPEKIKMVVQSIAENCKTCETVLIGGETAEMPDMYKIDDMDVAGFVVGIVDRENVITRDKVKENDIIVGIESSGLHSNGFSLVRKVIEGENLDLNKVYDWTGNKKLGELLLTPTKIYYNLVSKILEKVDVHGIAHITGGGFYENISRVIPCNTDAIIEKGTWTVPCLFNIIRETGKISAREMFKVFNMGIGMVLIISSDNFNTVAKVAQKCGENVYKIGRIAEGNGKVVIT